MAASLNSELNKLSTWFKANKLSLNLKKTNFMIFKPRQKRYHFPMQICINEQRIEQVKETVFLGVVLDEHLSWKPHISQVARKISKSIGVINRARFFLPKPCLKTLYYCLVYPYLHYCIIVPNRRTVSPEFLSWVRTRWLLSSHSCPVRSPSFPNQTKELPMTRKTFRMLSAEAIQFAPRKFCFWRITMYRK